MPVTSARVLTGAIVVAAGVLAGGSSRAQWVYVEDNELAYHGMQDIDFANESVGFAVGGRAIVRTTDGGRSWQISDTLTFKGKSLFGVTVDSTVVGIIAVAVGTGLTIGRSSDLGESWEIVHANLNARLNEVCSRGGGDYRAFGEGAWFVGSVDNGLSWDPRVIFPSADIDAAACLPDGTIWAGGFWNDGGIGQCCGVLMKSDDSGQTWQVKLRPSSSDDGVFFGVQFVTDEVGYALSSTGFLRGRSSLWRTLDGGENWERMQTFPPAHAMLFLDEDVGLVGAFEGRVYSTRDGGATWSVDTLSLPVDLKGFHLLPDAVLAINDAGIFRNETFVSTTSDDSRVPLPTEAVFSIDAFPNPAVSRVTFRLEGPASEAASGVAVEITLFDVLGRPVRTARFDADARSASIPVDDLPAGLYFYRVNLEGGGLGTVVVAGR